MFSPADQPDLEPIEVDFVTPAGIYPGAAVRLVSGGQTMTAERIHTDADEPFARCVWMAHGKMQHAFLRLETLEPVPPDAPEPAPA
jgi:hypothetical protein